MTWRERTLGEVVRFRRGHDLPEQARKLGPVPVIGSAGQNGWHNEARATGPGVSIGRSGASIGKVTYTPVDYWPHNACLYVTDFLGNDPRFVYYFLQTKDLATLNSGAAQPSLNRNFVHTVPVRVPRPNEQAAIASVLSAYDDLIENNRRRISLLEEASRLLYREWFVHFQFPGHEHVEIVDSLPKGWDRRTLGDVVEVVKKSEKPSDFKEHDIHIGLEHIPRRSFTLANWEPAEGLASGKWRFEEGDILFCKIRPYFHKVGFTMRRGLVSSDALVWRVHNEVDWPIVLCATSSDHFVAVASKTVREGSKMPRADWTDDMLVAPYNHSAVATRMVAEHAQDLAAVIVEPLQRCTSSRVGFLENQRAACTKHDVLLMFDEVVTGFRLARGDAQETSGILLIPMRCSGASSLGSLPVGNDGR